MAGSGVLGVTPSGSGLSTAVVDDGVGRRGISGALLLRHQAHEPAGHRLKGSQQTLRPAERLGARPSPGQDPAKTMTRVTAGARATGVKVGRRARRTVAFVLTSWPWCSRTTIGALRRRPSSAWRLSPSGIEASPPVSSMTANSTNAVSGQGAPMPLPVTLCQGGLDARSPQRLLLRPSPEGASSPAEEKARGSTHQERCSRPAGKGSNPCHPPSRNNEVRPAASMGPLAFLIRCLALQSLGWLIMLVAITELVGRLVLAPMRARAGPQASGLSMQPSWGAPPAPSACGRGSTCTRPASAKAQHTVACLMIRHLWHKLPI